MTIDFAIPLSAKQDRPHHTLTRKNTQVLIGGGEGMSHGSPVPLRVHGHILRVTGGGPVGGHRQRDSAAPRRSHLPQDFTPMECTLQCGPNSFLLRPYNFVPDPPPGMFSGGSSNSTEIWADVGKIHHFPQKQAANSDFEHSPHLNHSFTSCCELICKGHKNVLLESQFLMQLSSPPLPGGGGG